MTFKRFSVLISAAAALIAFFTPAAPVSAYDVSLYGPAKSSAEFYAEQWSASFWCEDGTYVHFQFAVSNMGIGDGKGGAKIEITAADGARLQTKKDFGSSWKSGKSEFSLSADGWKFEKNADGFKFSGGDDKISVDAAAVALAAAWRPGPFPFYKNDDGFYDYALLAPRASFTGTVKFAGETREFKGTGFVDRSVADMAPHKLAKRWLKFRFFSGEYACIFAGFAPPDAKGNAVYKGYLWLGKGSETLFSGTDVSASFSDFFIDKASKSRYELPSKIEISVASGDKRVAAALSKKKLLKRKEILKDLPFAVRKIAQSFSEPLDFVFSGSFEIKLYGADGSIRAEVSDDRDYVMQYINK